MRVTDDMTSKMAAKSGLPIYMSGMGGASKNTLLDALDKKSWEDEFDKLSFVDARKAKGLMNAADKMSEAGRIFDTDGKDTKLYEDARNHNDHSEVVEKIRGFASGYNNLLKELSLTGSGMMVLYRKELKNAALEQKEAFFGMGITFDKSGNMSVDDEKMKSMDLDEFKKNMDVFAHKVDFIAGRVLENANAEEESISSRYDAFGRVLSQGTGRFDFLG